MPINISIILFLLSLIFVWSGISKIKGDMTDRFLTWGYPEWFATILGTTELLAVVLLWQTKTQFFSLLFMFILMVAAICTLFANRELAHRYLPPIVVIGLLSILIYLS